MLEPTASGPLYTIMPTGSVPQPVITSKAKGAGSASGEAQREGVAVRAAIESHTAQLFATLPVGTVGPCRACRDALTCLAHDWVLQGLADIFASTADRVEGLVVLCVTALGRLSEGDGTGAEDGMPVGDEPSYRRCGRQNRAVAWHLTCLASDKGR